MKPDGNDMRLNISTAPTLRAIAAFFVLVCWSGALAAEPVVFEKDLPRPGAAEKAASYIVRAADFDAAAKAVESVGGRVIRVTGMNHAVRATLLPPQVELLQRRSDVDLTPEGMNATTSPDAARETSA